MCLTGVRLQTGFYFVVPDRARVSCQFRINYVWDMIRSLYALLWTYFFELNVRNSFYLFWFTYEVELFHQHGRIDLITDLLLIFWRLGTFILWTLGLILKLIHILASYWIYIEREREPIYLFLFVLSYFCILNRRSRCHFRLLTIECSYLFTCMYRPIENISLVYNTDLFYLISCFNFGHFVDIFIFLIWYLLRTLHLSWQFFEYENAFTQAK